MIRPIIAAFLEQAIESAQQAGELPAGRLPTAAVTPAPEHCPGDYASDIAHTIAARLGLAPDAVARIILRHLRVSDDRISRVHRKGGWLCVTLGRNWATAALASMLAAGERYGSHSDFAGKSALVEFVSADPHNPITVSAARGAALGDAIANLLCAVGYHVTREYYVNDVINSIQLRNLARAVEARYADLLSRADSGGRRGSDHSDHVGRIAGAIFEREGAKLAKLPPAQRAQAFSGLAQDEMLRLQKEDLEAFGTRFDNWYRERNLHDAGKVKEAIDSLASRGFTFELGGGLWLRSSAFGDEHDRVLVRDNGEATYIASDAAYHRDKFERGFSRLVNVWGPQHEAYIPRTKAAIRAMGYDANRLDVVIYQTVRLAAGGPAAGPSSQRSAGLVPLSDLLAEMDKDEARFMLLGKCHREPLDFELESGLGENVGTVGCGLKEIRAARQSALEMVLEARESGADLPSSEQLAGVALIGAGDSKLLRKLAEYPEEVRSAAETYSPHEIVRYVRELHQVFELFERRHRRNRARHAGGRDDVVLCLRAALAWSCANVFSHALAILGISP